MISWLILILITIIGFIICFFGKNEKYFVLRPDFFLFLSIYIYTIPISLNILLGENRFAITDQNLQIILICTISFLIFFLIGFHLVPTKKGNRLSLSSININYSHKSALFIAGVGLLVYVLNIKKSGGLVSLFILQRAELMETQQGILSIGILVWKAGILLIMARSWMITSLSTNRSQIFKYIGFIMLFSFIILNVLVGDRRIMVGLLIGVAFLFLIKNKTRISVKSLIIPLIIAVFFTHFISKVRHLTFDPVTMFTSIFTTFETSWLDISEGEVGAVFYVFNELLEDPNGINYLYGESYIKMPLILIPNFIVGKRTYNGLGDWFANKYHYDVWLTGGAFGFPFIAEAYINFWFFGTIIIGFIIGIGLKLWWNFCIINKPSVFSLALYALSLSMIFTLPRTDFSFVVKEFILSSLFSVLIIGIIGKIRV